MFEPLVSIIIPCYNYQKYIGDCITSCLEQCYQNIQIIVVDDASTDRSLSVIRETLANEDIDNLVISLDRNGGYSNAKNEGIKEAKGEWVVHIDADDMLTKMSILSRLAVAENHKEADIIHGYALKIQGEAGYGWCVENQNKLQRHPSRLHAQGFMIKRSVFEKYGLYYSPLRSKGDKEYWFRLGVHDESPFDKKVNIRRCHDDVAFYRRHELAMHKMRKKNKKYDDEINGLFNARMKELKKNGITKDNTEWL